MSPEGSAEPRQSARLLVLGSGILVLVAIAPVAIGLAGAVIVYEICKRVPLISLGYHLAHPSDQSRVAATRHV